MSRKVYIPSIPTRYDAATDQRVPSVDLNPASKYGDLTAMSMGIGTDQDQIHEVARRAKEITGDDYILCVGDVVLTAVAISVASKHNEKIVLLRWDKYEKHYNEIEVRI